MIDSFVDTSPVIIALVSAIFFVALSTYIALCQNSSQKHQNVDAFMPAIGRCTITGLPSGSSNLGAYETLVQEPVGCLQSITSNLEQKVPSFVILVGRVDGRELSPPTQKLYKDNFTLAYQRAVAVRTILLRMYVEQGKR